MTRARVTQVMNLVNLAPGVQEAFLTGKVAAIERALRASIKNADWGRQEARLTL
jgi:hypothetical protein